MEAAPQPKTSPSDWAERFSISLHRQRDRVREFLRAQRERLARAEGELTVQLRSLAEQLAREHAEKDRLLACHEEQILALKQRPAAAGAAGIDRDDLYRRYEMAMQDLREARARIDELQQQLNRQRAEGGKPSAAPAQVLDWEAEKRRILAELEQEPGNAQEGMAARSEIQKVIERTDRILADKDRLLADKDREIAELKTLLENQSASVGSMAVGAVALGGLLDTDEIIREQREGLKQLQEELQRKLREAEIETSLERAKIARERTQLEERLRQFEAQDLAPPAAADNPLKDSPQKGRWLSRLGLKEEPK